MRQEWFERLNTEYSSNLTFEFHTSRLSMDTVELLLDLRILGGGLSNQHWKRNGGSAQRNREEDGDACPSPGLSSLPVFSPFSFLATVTLPIGLQSLSFQQRVYVKREDRGLLTSVVPSFAAILPSPFLYVLKSQGEGLRALESAKRESMTDGG